MSVVNLLRYENGHLKIEKLPNKEMVKGGWNGLL